MRRRGEEISTLIFFHHILFLSSLAFLLNTPACCCSSSERYLRRQSERQGGWGNNQQLFQYSLVSHNFAEPCRRYLAWRAWCYRLSTPPRRACQPHSDCHISCRVWIIKCCIDYPMIDLLLSEPYHQHWQWTNQWSGRENENKIKRKEVTVLCNSSRQVCAHLWG